MGVVARHIGTPICTLYAAQAPEYGIAAHKVRAYCPPPQCPLRVPLEAVPHSQGHYRIEMEPAEVVLQVQARSP